MLRGTTARTLFAVLAAVLLALQLSAPTTTFASASAHATHGTGPKGQAEFVTCGETEHPTGPTGPLRTRDRIRAADHVPQTPARPLLGKVSAADHEDPSHVAATVSHGTKRSSTAHSTAALQVFRC